MSHRVSRVRWLVVALAFALPLTFAAFTGHAWEDYFITLRCSRNLVEGHGLVFNPGQRVHAFTSPLGVLLPALCTAVAGPGRETAALWLFRLFSAGCLAAAAGLLWTRARALQLGALGGTVLCGLLLADPKLTDFATNGMETAILVLFVALAWSELQRPAGTRVGYLAVAFAGLMWTRPDAFVLAGALALPHLLFRSPGETSAAPAVPSPWPSLWRAALLGALLYAPWLIWAGWYYGTPVPHTIVAKSAYTPAVHLRDLLLLPWRVITGDAMLVDLFLPSYWVFGGWPAWLAKIAHGLSVVTAFAWLVPQAPLVVRRLSLTIFLGMFYLCALILFPWYVPPWSVLACVAIAFLADAVYARAKQARLALWAGAVRIAVVVLLVAQAGQWLGTAWQMRVQQQFVETPVRRAVGEWLHEHAGSSDTVFLEPLGYIGYFSQLKTYDFPGLSSPEVVRSVKAGHKSYAALIAELRPDWVVLRPAELARPEFTQLPVLTDYDLVHQWSARGELDGIAWLPGRPWVEFESSYLLFHRKASPARGS